MLIAIIGILDLNGLCRLLGSTETILPYARIYAFYILVSAPAMASSCVMNNVLQEKSEKQIDYSQEISRLHQAVSCRNNTIEQLRNENARLKNELDTYLLFLGKI